MSRFLVVLACLFLSTTAVAADQELRLQGSNTIGAKLAPALARAWLQAKGYGDIKEQETAPEEERVVGRNGRGDTLAVVIRAHGSTTAFSGLLAKEADVGMASRPIKDKEVVELADRGAMNRPACEHVVGLDGIAVIVNPANPIDTLDTNTIRDIFSGRITKWSQLGGPARPIHVYARDDKSGTYDTFKHLVLSKEAPLTAAAKRFESNADLSDSVAADADGIGFVGLPYVRQSKALAVSEQGTRAIRPDAFSVATEDYVLARRLFLYVPSAPANPLAQEFASFALADHGQTVVEQVGFVSQHIIAGNMVAADDAPEEYRDLTRNARRLSLNFRFLSGSAELDSKAHRDVERLLSYMARSEFSGSRLLLLGFADHNEVMPYHSLELSVQRVDTVADLLIRQGVEPARVRGYGSALPVASNDNNVGRQKNRRVEVWISSPDTSALATPWTISSR